jgi:hypothetical protein
MRGWRIVEKLVCSDQRGFDGCGWRWRHNRGGHTLARRSGRGGDHHPGGGATTHTTISPNHGVGSSLPLSLLLVARGMGGGSHGMDVHHGVDTGTPRTMKNPLPGTPNVKMVL